MSTQLGKHQAELTATFGQQATEKWEDEVTSAESTRLGNGYVCHPGIGNGNGNRIGSGGIGIGNRNGNRIAIGGIGIGIRKQNKVGDRDWGPRNQEGGDK